MSRDTTEEFSAATQSLNPAETLQPVRDLWSTMRLNWYRSDGIEWYRRRWMVQEWTNNTGAMGLNGTGGDEWRRSKAFTSRITRQCHRAHNGKRCPGETEVERRSFPFSSLLCAYSYTIWSNKVCSELHFQQAQFKMVEPELSCACDVDKWLLLEALRLWGAG